MQFLVSRLDRGCNWVISDWNVKICSRFSALSGGQNFYFLLSKIILKVQHHSCMLLYWKIFYGYYIFFKCGLSYNYINILAVGLFTACDGGYVCVRVRVCVCVCVCVRVCVFILFHLLVSSGYTTSLTYVRSSDQRSFVLSILLASAKFLHLYFWICLISPPKTKTPATTYWRENDMI